MRKLALNKRFCKSGGLSRMFFVLKYGQILNCIKYTAMFTLSSFVSGRCNLIRLLIREVDLDLIQSIFIRIFRELSMLHRRNAFAFLGSQINTNIPWFSRDGKSTVPVHKLNRVC
jgi:hypothetical protein